MQTINIVYATILFFIKLKCLDLQKNYVNLA